MTLYSMKMRASRTEKGKSEHISGAERILPENALAKNAGAMIERALHHSKGRADYIQVKIEEARPEEIERIEALPVSTRETANAAEGQETILSFLREIGVANGDAVMKKFRETYAMRGAMLLDADTLERLEPDPARGIRATYMDAEYGDARGSCAGKNHFGDSDCNHGGRNDCNDYTRWKTGRF